MAAMRPSAIADKSAPEMSHYSVRAASIRVFGNCNVLLTPTIWSARRALMLASDLPRSSHTRAKRSCSLIASTSLFGRTCSRFSDQSLKILLPVEGGAANLPSSPSLVFVYNVAPSCQLLHHLGDNTEIW